MRLHQPTVQELQNALASAKTCVSKIEEALGTAGKPGSGPEFPPEGYALICKGDIKDGMCYVANIGWTALRTTSKHPEAFTGYKMLAFAVPIVPKPEPVKLSDQEKMVGWRGPTGFRLQTFQNRECACVVCRKTIKAGERLARWRHRFPEQFDGFVQGKDSNDDHSHAHVDCLYKASGRHAVCGLLFSETPIPLWLMEKRQKYDAQQIAP